MKPTRITFEMADTRWPKIAGDWLTLVVIGSLLLSLTRIGNASKPSHAIAAGVLWFAVSMVLCVWAGSVF